MNTDLTRVQTAILDTLDPTVARTPAQMKRLLPGVVPVATIRAILGDLIAMGYVVADPSGLSTSNATPYRIADGLKCPGDCHHLLHPVQARNALSRFDNTTYVCSSCGTNEAFAPLIDGTLVAPGHVRY